MTDELGMRTTDREEPTDAPSAGPETDSVSVVAERRPWLPSDDDESDGGESLKISAETEFEHATPNVRSRPKSATALDLDEWSLRRGREVFRASDRMAGVFKNQTKGAELLVADFHAAAFEPIPQLVEEGNCANERLHRYMQQLMDTPEFKQLHSETQLDEVASEMATVAFAESWVKLAATECPEGELQQNLQNLRSASEALKSAKSDVRDLRDCQGMLGLGGDGGAHNRIDSNQLQGFFKRVKNSTCLKRISQLAGRYRRFAQARQRKKVFHGRDDVVGVVQSGDLSRVLPSELACLGDEFLELDVLRRMVESQLMSRDYRGIQSKARGPIVVVVDESGSMSGEPIATAKAMALALAWIARHQRRWCALVGFSGGTEGTFCVIPPGKENPEELMDWLEHFFSGGTDMDVPLDVLPKRWHEIGAPKGITDIVVITDAIVRIPPKMRDSFLAWKAEEKVKMISLIINQSPGDMAQVSDRIHCVESLGFEEDGVQEAMSV